METLQAERRAVRHLPHEYTGPIDDERVVRQAIALQASMGTRGAVEFLKAYGVHGTVIGRVLSGGAIRTEDRMARDHPVAWE